MAASASTSSSAAWDAARRDARRVESELDAELASFSKLVAASGADDLFSNSNSSSSAVAARRGSGVGGEAGLAADALAASKAATVERLLQRLALANDALAQAAESTSSPGSASTSADGGGAAGGAASAEPSSSSSSSSEARRHTAARHRAVLRDSQAEFRRLSGVLSAARERADLFAGFGGGGNGGNGSDNAPPANATSSLLLRERSALSSAHAALDGLLGTASAAGTALFDQRGRLGGAAGRLAAIGDRFPVVGGLLTAIGRRKERDTIIVSAVAGGCAFFTFLYWLRK